MRTFSQRGFAGKDFFLRFDKALRILLAEASKAKIAPRSNDGC
jgi:hypothetical protein